MGFHFYIINCFQDLLILWVFTSMSPWDKLMGFWAHRIHCVSTFYFLPSLIKTQLSHYFIFFFGLTLCLLALFFFFFLFSASDDTQKSHRSRHRVHKSSGSSHKTMCRSFSCDSQSKGSISTPRGPMVPHSYRLVIFTLFSFFLSFSGLENYEVRFWFVI